MGGGGKLRSRPPRIRWWLLNLPERDETHRKSHLCPFLPIYKCRGTSFPEVSGTDKQWRRAREAAELRLKRREPTPSEKGLKKWGGGAEFSTNKVFRRAIRSTATRHLSALDEKEEEEGVRAMPQPTTQHLYENQREQTVPNGLMSHCPFGEAA